LLTHHGRKTGKLYNTVVEVVRRDRPSGTYYIASGWGEKANWLRNIEANPDVTISAGGRRFPARAVRLPTDEAEKELSAYARRHPIAARVLGRLLLGKNEGKGGRDFEALARRLPVVAIARATASD
jgi:deazaflavin-dependent oxidoreductase (nitroreductase family)